MNRFLRYTFLFFVSILVFSCSVILLKPTVTINENPRNFKYVYIPGTETINSSVGGTTYGGYFYSTGKSVNPADLITGAFSKRGFIKLPELSDDLIDQTLIVNYGESGRRTVGLGYTIEVTIQLVSAKNNSLISSCTAEGIGDTEADDIRIAIDRCLSSLFDSTTN